MTEYDFTFFEYFNALKRSIKITPLYLGAVAVGSGAPPGGYVGYLPQSRVSYDQAEVSLSGFADDNPINASGIIIRASLVDNMNHIRYRLEQIEGTSSFAVYDDGVLVVDGITVLDFDDNITATHAGSGYVNITGDGIVILNDAVLVASGISILDFSSDFTVTDVGGGKVTVALT